MPLITGLKFKLGTTIQTANLNLQAVPAEQTLEPIASTIVSITPGKGAGNVDKKVLSIGQVKKSLNPGGQQGPGLKFTKPLISLPPLSFIPKNVATVLPLKKLDMLKVVKFVEKFKKPAALKGISEQRPEILAMTDFQPIYADSSKKLNTVGEMLEFQIAARRMRIDNIKKLLDTLNDTKDAKDLMIELKDEYIDNINKAREDVEFLVSMLTKLDAGRRALNFRRLTSASSQLFGVKSRTWRSLFNDELGFTEEGYNEFSNTKVFGQFIFDLQTISRQYSPSLLDAFDGDRAKDKDPVTYAKAIDIRDGKFKFNVEKLSKSFSISSGFGSTPSFVNMGFTPRFVKLINSLPKDLDDRAKVLLLTLSKELRVSDGLGDKSVNKILTKTFGSASPTVGNPFDEILGRPGDNITDVPIGESSMSSLARVTDDDEVILPFEQAFLQTVSGRTFYPGTKFFIDGILTSKTPFDLTNFRTYKKRFERITTDTNTLFDRFFGLNDNKRTLYADDLLFTVMADLSALMETAVSKNKIGVLMPVALLAVGNSDKKLKSMLFQYMLLLGLNGQGSADGTGVQAGEIGGTSPSEFFERMSFSEVDKFSSLSELDGLEAPEAEPPENPDLDVPDYFTPFGPDTLTSDTFAIRSAIISLREKIVARTQKTVKSGAKAKLADFLSPSHFTSSEFVETLSKNSQFFEMMGLFIQSIEDQTKSENGYIIDDNSGRTRYNKLTTSTIAAMAFEVYSSLATKYIKVGFTSATNNSIILKANPDSIKEVLDSIKENLGVISNPAKKAGFGGLKLQSNQGGLLPLLQATKITQQGPGGFNLQNNTPSPNKILADSLNELREKLSHEDDLIRELVERLSKTTDRIVESFDDIEEFFDPDGSNQTRLIELADGEDANEKLPLISEAQVRLAQKALADLEETDSLSMRTGKHVKKQGFKLPKLKGLVKKLKKLKNLKKKYPKVDVPAFFDDSEISQEVEAMMWLMLDKNKYRIDKGENLKILSVGLPAGFLETITTVIDASNSDFDEVLSRENDIISINVYRRDIEHEDIVFKPKSYIFEMSRFVSRSTFDTNADVITQGSFDVLVDSHVFMRDFSRFVKGQKSTGENIFKNSRYDFLSNREKEDLIENHMTSYLLSVYNKLLTGVSLDEADYYVNDSVHAGNIDDETQARFEKIMELYVSGLAGKPITLDQLKKSNPQIKTLLSKINKFAKENSLVEQIPPPKFPGVSRSAAIEITEDLISFVKTFNPHSFLTGGNAHRQQITSPRLFERVFNLSVDPDDFEIDVTNTVSTKSGKRAYAALTAQGLIVEKTKKLATIKGKKKFFKNFSKLNTSKGYFIKARSLKRNIAFDEFFVTISTVGDFVA